jgi:hypothetical protein
MGQHVDTLKQARSRIVQIRRQVVSGLAAEFDDAKTPKLMESLVGIEAVLHAIDRAIEEEVRLEAV